MARIIRSIVVAFISILFFPFAATWKISQQSWHQGTKLLAAIASSIVLIPIWLVIQVAIVLAIWNISPFLGLRQITIPTSGPSMQPTLSETSELSVNIYPGIGPLKHTIENGDIVVFSNAKSEEYLEKEKKDRGGLVKRVIGVAQDKIVIKDGFVFRNGSLIEEPYTLKPRSTFGGETIRDCQEVIIPENMVFVLGDNRKQSADSRHLGLVSLSDIHFYRSIKKQEEFAKKWRETGRDKDSQLTTTLEGKQYVELINAKRKGVKVQQLHQQVKLSQSAEKRAAVILKYDDLSFEATRSGYTMERALEDVGYSNIVWGETATFGYYDAEELVNHYLEFPKSRKFILQSDFQETGISVKVGEVNGCPTQVIVQHFAGYKPPNYKAEDIASWRQALQTIQQTIVSWEEAKNYENVNKEDLTKLLDSLYRQRTIATAILSKMEANRWLTKAEEQDAKNFESLAKESASLAERLNNQGRR